MIQKNDKKIVLEDGQEFFGLSFGAQKDAVLEIVFNTSMAGYQEILSDPSYTGQAVVMTYPLIGNYGTAKDDYETETPTIGALVVRDYNDEPSNFRSEKTLAQVMERYGVVGIAGVDTRKLARTIRDCGTRKALLTDASLPLSEALSLLQTTPLPCDAVPRVSCKEPIVYPVERPRFHVVAIDCGMKQNMVRSLGRRGCLVTAVPWNTSAAKILSMQPDGILVSNGPGDPTDVPETVETVKALIGKRPLFGICLGHQSLSLAYGAKTYKLKFGHRGGNHPVKDLDTGKIEITSQNHSYAVDEASISATPLRVTHKNILDGTVEGVTCENDLAFSVQYHPESAPGPQDSAYLFDRFLANMEKGGRHA